MPRKAEIAARLPFRIALDQDEAAASLSLSTSKFRQLVDAGLMPRGRLAGTRVLYDVDELRIAYRSLPRQGDDEHADSWADFK